MKTYIYAASALLLLLPGAVRSQSAVTPDTVLPATPSIARSSLPTTPAQREALRAVAEQGLDAIRAGDAATKAGDWKDAASDYNSALAFMPGYPTALYGLARCAEANGDTALALGYYRQAIYVSVTPPLLPKIKEPYAFHVMPFVLLLNKEGQVPEAVFVYNEMVRRMEYDSVDGSLMLKVLLPQFGDGLGQEPYSPQEFEAMVHLANGVDTNEDAQEREELQKAITITPASAAANYYWGKYLFARDYAQAKPYLQRAVDLGDDRTVTAAKVYLDCIH